MLFFKQELSRDAASQAYVVLHFDFVTIHPFDDGNGRLARLLSNLPVLKAGFPPIVVPSTDRQAYKEAISCYQATIPDLAEVNDMAAFPDNTERTRFLELCTRYWTETMTLLENAQMLQRKRNDRKL